MEVLVGERARSVDGLRVEAELADEEPEAGQVSERACVGAQDLNARSAEAEAS